MPRRATLSAAGSEPRTYASLLLESIALRHQIAVLKRSRTRRPCFRQIDRLFWILLSRWWPRWREGLVMVQPETILRWRRNGWSAIWRHRSRGRWRGGRPRVSSEIRDLIRQMARENFLWGAPRIHGELLMLGFRVSQATVSRYLPAAGSRPTQSWRTFLRNQASAFREYSEQRTEGTARLNRESSWARLIRLAAARNASVKVGLGCDLALPPTAPNAPRIGLRPTLCERGGIHSAHRLATVSTCVQKMRSNRFTTAIKVRSSPREARASPKPQSRASR